MLLSFENQITKIVNLQCECFFCVFLFLIPDEAPSYITDVFKFHPCTEHFDPPDLVNPILANVSS